jgi:hypothetical protein
MIESNPFNGVGISGVSWTIHAHAPAAAAAHAPMPRKRRIAAATFASVNRGTF